MHNLTLTIKEVEKINSVFPDGEPLLIVDGDEFKEASADFKERLKAKAIELGYLK